MTSTQPNIVPLDELNNIPVLDIETLEQLKDVDDGRLELAREMFGIFKADTPPRLSAIKAAIEANDFVKLREVSHALKGSCGTIGAARVRIISAVLEAYGRGCKIEAPPDEIFKCLQNASDEACRALESFIDDDTGF
ncbi:MAG: Hpt domain-containing protein [Holophagales bacterium]|jgi:HPt (histidine-containing phosphotransfer) domain-containing protein|nr:Hpt domain-containing protein [Holophagales bacterium]